MSFGNILRVVLVVLLLAPLVIWQGIAGSAPAWLESREFGAPLSAYATVGWFAIFILLSLLFANAQAKGEKK